MKEYMYFESINNFSEFISKLNEDHIDSFSDNPKFMKFQKEEKKMEVISQIDNESSISLKSLFNHPNFGIMLKFIQINLYSVLNSNLNEIKKNGNFENFISTAVNDHHITLENFFDQAICEEKNIDEENKQNILNKMIEMVEVNEKKNNVLFKPNEINYFLGLLNIPYIQSIKEGIILGQFEEIFNSKSNKINSKKL